jgi:PTH1 family peptidyl-tRNA hydrolase
MVVVLGLGNPGQKYEMTRHNMGYLVVQALADELKWPWKRSLRFHGHLSSGKWEGRDLYLLLPTTYMNESGRAAQSLLSYYKLTNENLIVVTDDIAFPFGELRIKPFGSSGGHNGLKSVEAHLGTQRYVRLRMGIGDKQHKTLSDHVLSGFSEEEFKELPTVILKGVKALKRLITEDLASVMNDVNKGTK